MNMLLVLKDGTLVEGPSFNWTYHPEDLLYYSVYSRLRTLPPKKDKATCRDIRNEMNTRRKHASVSWPLGIIDELVPELDIDATLELHRTRSQA